MDYYPNMKTKITRFGLPMTEQSKAYQHHINGFALHRYDVLETLEEFLNIKFNLAKYNIPFNLKTIRPALLRMLLGEILDDQQYIECIRTCMLGSPLLRSAYLVLFSKNTNTTIFEELIIPAVEHVLQKYTELERELGGEVIMRDSGYLYILNPRVQGGYGHVEIR